eukprot:TRINITY_DN3012_c0_g1_i1.p1 TRINITY_DN3012_c0_g1~~TRINITY_DN3012_c0_g1_i1.p1  ORF type:complete len:398 (+),score=43.09 TRINITY_DN3012_c0_g1_i1:47-1195(+)
MQIFVSFPDAGYPDIVFEVTAKSLVADAAQAAADEWDVDVDFLEISFDGSLIPLNSQLMSHGVEGGSQLTASLLRVFGNKWFIDDTKRELLMRHLSRIDEQHLSLDTPTFATDGCFEFDMAWIPNKIEVSFVNPHPSVTSAMFSEPQLYGDAIPVLKIDLLGLRHITTIADDFLSNCSLLKELDVSCLTNLTSVHSYFLAACPLIETLNVSGLNNLTWIGRYFLGGCASLTALDLGSFNNVTSAGSGFLGGCSSLRSLDLSSLSKLTEINDRFLSTCILLSTVNLLSFSNITAIGSGFLQECSALSTLDLSAFVNVTSIGNTFLCGCRLLASIKIASLSNVSKVGDRFLLGCTSLTETDVDSLSPESEIRKLVEQHVRLQCE